MQQSFFYSLGTSIYRFRKFVLSMMGVLLLCCLPWLGDIMSPFHSTGFVDNSSQSAKTQAFLDQHLKFHHENQFLILYHSKSLTTSNPLYMYKVKHSLMLLDDFPIEHDIVFPDMNPEQISKDEHTAYAVVTFHRTKPLTSSMLKEFKESIKDPSHMDVYLGGEAIFADGVNQQTQDDLYKADMVAAPLSIIVLILVFGSLVAASVPMVLGGACAILILTTLYALGHLVTLSVFTLNIALLLGLCLNLDYALFIIYRFRQELKEQQGDVSVAIGKTLMTAGRAVFFSGLAVFVSLSALLFFPINILFSMGVGGLTATFIAVLIAIVILPAVLSVLGHRIHYFPVTLMDNTGHRLFIRWRNWIRAFRTYPLLFFIVNVLGSVFLFLFLCWQWLNNLIKRMCLWFSKDTTSHVWRTMAVQVVKHPIRFFISSLVILLSLGYPFLNVYFGISDFKILPKHSLSRQFFDTYQAEFNQNELTPIVLVIKKSQGSILTKTTIGQLYDFATRLEANAKVLRVDSIVTSSQHRLKKEQYQALYTHPAYEDASVKVLLNNTTRSHFTVMNVVSMYDVNAKETKQLIGQLRRMHPGQGLSLEVTGTPAINLDVSDKIAEIFPFTVTWIAVLTYVILFFVLRSIFLPFKAIFMNVLSLTASYGVMVYVFQEGHLHHLLHFAPQGIIDISLLIIVFCAIFGFSMDYEVFLLTRIQEAYYQTRDNALSIIYGIDHSSRIITSAALIVICICGSFMVADVLMVKEFGLGIAVAIFVDAFIIRTLLVPATMVLLKRWNWYLPRWMERLLPKYHV